MTNLGVKDLHFEIEQNERVFVYRVSFLFDFTGRRYLATGSAPSPEQCFDAAMSYLANTVRAAVE